MEGHPKVQQRGQGRRSRAPRGVFSEGWGDERPQPAPPTHGLVYWLITHTPSMYTNINIAMYTFTWDLWPTQTPVSGSGALRGAGTRRREPGGGRGPAPLLSQHPQSVLSLCSSAGRVGAKHLRWLESRASPLTFPSGSPPRLFPGPWVSASVSLVSPRAWREVGARAPAPVLAPPASSWGSQEAGAAVQLGGGASAIGRLSAGGRGHAAALPGAAVLDEDVGTLLAASAASVGQRGQAAGVPAPHVHPILQKEARSHGWQERCGSPPTRVGGGGEDGCQGDQEGPPNSPR